jgi:RNA polymerase sigma-70 factor (ECF subfamily)
MKAESGERVRASEADAALVEAILAGEKPAFSALYERYRPRVFGFVLKRVGCAAEAEDLTQETFVIAHRCLGAFEGRSSFSSWLLGIAKNVCRRSARYAARWMVGTGRARPIDALVIGVDARIESRVDALRALDRCNTLLRESLTEPQVEIFRLRYAENRSIRAIATELGKSSDAVKASLRRARKALAERAPEIEASLGRAA